MQVTSKYRFYPSFNLESIVMNLRQYSILKGAFIRSNEERNNVFSFSHKSMAYIIAGIQGNGKKLAAEAFAGTADKCGYDVYRFPVSELMGDSQEETYFEINELLDDMEILLSKHNRKVFFLFDDIWLFNDDSRAGKTFFSKLYKLMDSAPGHVIVAAAFDGAPSEIPEIYRGTCVRIIPLRKPDEEQRALFFESFLEDFFNEEEGVTAEYISSLTDGFTYGELNALTQDLICMAKGYCLEDTEEEAVPLRDEIHPATLISKEEISETVEDMVACRFSGADKGVRRSVFNYPKAKAVQAVSAIGGIPESVIQSAKNIADDMDKGKMELTNLNDQISKENDLNLSFDPDALDEMIIEEI